MDLEVRITSLKYQDLTYQCSYDILYQLFYFRLLEGIVLIQWRIYTSPYYNRPSTANFCQSCSCSHIVQNTKTLRILLDLIIIILLMYYRISIITQPRNFVVLMVTSVGGTLCIANDQTTYTTSVLCIYYRKIEA